MRVNPLSDSLLFALEKTVDGYLRLEDFVENTHIYARGYQRVLSKSSLSKNIRKLRLKGFIDCCRISRKMVIKLTDSGMQELINRKAMNNDKWDGKWRIVCFDIPEEFKQVRNLLRVRLKIWQFNQLQRSVWISKKPVLVLLEKFVNEVGIAKWVVMIETETLIKK